MAQFQVTFTNSFGYEEQQSCGERETIALLQRLPKLNAIVVSVLAPTGDKWTGEETLRRLTAA